MAAPLFNQQQTAGYSDPGLTEEELAQIRAEVEAEFAQFLQPGKLRSSGWDYPKGVAAGLIDLPADIAGLAEWGAGGLGAESVARGIGAARGFLSIPGEAIRETYSPAAKAAQQKQWLTTNPDEAAWADPRAIAMGASESLPSMFVPMGTAVKMGKMAKAAALGRGMGLKEAQALGLRRAAAAGAVSEGALSGGQTASQITDDIMAMDEAELRTTFPEYDAYLQEYGDPAMARYAVAELARGAATGVNIAASMAAGAAGGYAFGRIAEKGAGPLGRFWRGGLAEMGQETPQSGAEQAAYNYGMRNPLMEGVGEAAVAGGVIGGLTGGAFGVVIGRRPDKTNARSKGLADDAENAAVNANKTPEQLRQEQINTTAQEELSGYVITPEEQARRNQLAMNQEFGVGPPTAADLGPAGLARQRQGTIDMLMPPEAAEQPPGIIPHRMPDTFPSPRPAEFPPGPVERRSTLTPPAAPPPATAAPPPQFDMATPEGRQAYLDYEFDQGPPDRRQEAATAAEQQRAEEMRQEYERQAQGRRQGAAQLGLEYDDNPETLAREMEQVVDSISPEQQEDPEFKRAMGTVLQKLDELAAFKGKKDRSAGAPYRQLVDDLELAKRAVNSRLTAMEAPAQRGIVTKASQTHLDLAQRLGMPALAEDEAATEYSLAATVRNPEVMQELADDVTAAQAKLDKAKELPRARNFGGKGRRSFLAERKKANAAAVTAAQEALTAAQARYDLAQKIAGATEPAGPQQQDLFTDQETQARQGPPKPPRQLPPAPGRTIEDVRGEVRSKWQSQEAPSTAMDWYGRPDWRLRTLVMVDEGTPQETALAAAEATQKNMDRAMQQREKVFTGESRGVKEPELYTMRGKMEVEADNAARGAAARAQKEQEQAARDRAKKEAEEWADANALQRGLAYRKKESELLAKYLKDVKPWTQEEIDAFADKHFNEQWTAYEKSERAKIKRRHNKFSMSDSAKIARFVRKQFIDLVRFALQKHLGKVKTSTLTREALRIIDADPDTDVVSLLKALTLDPMVLNKEEIKKQSDRIDAFVNAREQMMTMPVADALFLMDKLELTQEQRDWLEANAYTQEEEDTKEVGSAPIKGAGAGAAVSTKAKEEAPARKLRPRHFTLTPDEERGIRNNVRRAGEKAGWTKAQIKEETERRLVGEAILAEAKRGTKRVIPQSVEAAKARHGGKSFARRTLEIVTTKLLKADTAEKMAAAHELLAEWVRGFDGRDNRVRQLLIRQARQNKFPENINFIAQALLTDMVQKYAPEMFQKPVQAEAPAATAAPTTEAPAAKETKPKGKARVDAAAEKAKADAALKTAKEAAAKEAAKAAKDAKDAKKATATAKKAELMALRDAQRAKNAFNKEVNTRVAALRTGIKLRANWLNEEGQRRMRNGAPYGRTLYNIGVALGKGQITKEQAEEKLLAAFTAKVRAELKAEQEGTPPDDTTPPKGTKAKVERRSTGKEKVKAAAKRTKARKEGTKAETKTDTKAEEKPSAEVTVVDEGKEPRERVLAAAKKAGANPKMMSDNKLRVGPYTIKFNADGTATRWRAGYEDGKPDALWTPAMSTTLEEWATTTVEELLDRAETFDRGKFMETLHGAIMAVAERVNDQKAPVLEVFKEMQKRINHYTLSDFEHDLALFGKDGWSYGIQRIRSTTPNMSTIASGKVMKLYDANQWEAAPSNIASLWTDYSGKTNETKVEANGSAEARGVGTGQTGGSGGGWERPGTRSPVWPKEEPRDTGDVREFNGYPTRDQRRGVNVILNGLTKGGPGADALIADGTGFGKTTQMLMLAKKLLEKPGNEGKKILIVIQNADLLKPVRGQPMPTWVRDATGLGVYDLMPAKGETGIDGASPIQFVTYAWLSKLTPDQKAQLGSIKYAAVMLDEAHNVKNIGAQVSMMTEIIDTDHRVYTSATPIDSLASIDFLAQLTGEAPDDFAKRSGFVRKMSKGEGYLWYPSPKVNDPTLNTAEKCYLRLLENLNRLAKKLGEAGLMIRRLLPSQSTMTINKVPLNKLDSPLFAPWGGLRELLGKINTHYDRRTRLHMASQILETAKAGQVLETIKKELARDPNRQVVVGISMHGRDKTNTAGITVKTYPGDTGTFISVPSLLEVITPMMDEQIGSENWGTYVYQDSMKALNDFQAGKKRVLFVTYGKGGTGVDLDDQLGTRPRTLVLATVPYSGVEHDQMNGRIDRAMTKSPSDILVVSSDSWVDRRREQLLATKRGIMDAFLNDKIMNPQDVGNTTMGAMPYTVQEEGSMVRVQLDPTVMSPHQLQNVVDLLKKNKVNVLAENGFVIPKAVWDNEVKGKLDTHININVGHKVLERPWLLHDDPRIPELAEQLGDVLDSENGTSVRRVVDVLLDNLPENSRFRPILDVLRSLQLNIPVYYSRDVSQYGYDTFNGKVTNRFIRLNPGDSIAAIHEIMHAATVHKLQDSSDPAVAHMRRLYNYAKSVLESKYGKETARGYGFTSLEEFVAEANSNPAFQDELAKIKSPPHLRIKGGNLWEAFKRIVRELLGMEHIDGSVLEDVLKLTPHVMQLEEEIAGRPHFDDDLASQIPGDETEELKQKARAMFAAVRQITLAQPALRNAAKATTYKLVRDVGDGAIMTWNIGGSTLNVNWDTLRHALKFEGKNPEELAEEYAGNIAHELGHGMDFNRFGVETISNNKRLRVKLAVHGAKITVVPVGDIAKLIHENFTANNRMFSWAAYPLDTNGNYKFYNRLRQEGMEELERKRRLRVVNELMKSKNIGNVGNLPRDPSHSPSFVSALYEGEKAIQSELWAQVVAAATSAQYLGDGVTHAKLTEFFNEAIHNRTNAPTSEIAEFAASDVQRAVFGDAGVATRSADANVAPRSRTVYNRPILQDIEARGGSLAARLADTVAARNIKGAYDVLKSEGRRLVKLPLMTMRQIDESFGHMLGTTLTHYYNLQDKVDRLVHKFQNAVHAINKEWGVFGKAFGTAKHNLDNVMGEATKYGMHPDLPFDAEEHKHLRGAVDDEGKWVPFDDDIIDINRKQWARINKLYREMGEGNAEAQTQAQGIYAKVRDYYKQEWEDQVNLLKANIASLYDKENVWKIENINTLEDLEALKPAVTLDKDGKPKAPTKQAQEDLEAYKDAIADVLGRSKLPGPYFPFKRTGDLVVEAFSPPTTHVTGVTREAARKLKVRLKREDPSLLVHLVRTAPNTYKVVSQERHTRFFESRVEANQFHEDMGKLFGAVPALVTDPDTIGEDLVQVEYKTGVQNLSRREKYQVADMMPPALARRLQEKLKGSPRLMNTLHEAIITMMPETSLRKAELHRGNVRGHMEDMRRAFAIHGRTAAHYKAQLTYGRQLNEAMHNLEQHAKQSRSLFGRPTLELDDVVNEIKLRDAMSAQAPEYRKFMDHITQFGYFWFLVSPSYWVLNAMQPHMIATPWLGARFGHARAASAMTEAYGATLPEVFQRMKKLRFGAGVITGKDVPQEIFEFLDGKGAIGKELQDNIRKNKSLTPERQEELIKMLNELGQTGLIDMTFSADIRSAAEGREGRLERFAEWARVMPHLTEVMNRTTTAIAAYNLARSPDINGKVMTHEQAIKYATDAVAATQFDYNAANKPRYFSDKFFGLARPVFMFKQYVQHMYYLMLRSLAQGYQVPIKKMLQGIPVSEEEKNNARIARRTFVGVSATHMMSAGIVGGIFEPIKWALGLALMAFSDDDEPFNPERDLQEFLADMFGPEAAQILAKGLPQLAGIDISNRVNISDLIFMGGPTGGADGREWLQQKTFELLGPMGSVAANAAEGLKDFREGDVLRGIERLTPKGIRDVVRAFRYQAEGVKDTNGNTIMAPANISPVELFMQSIGFTPAEISQMYQRRGFVKEAEIFFQQRRATLLERYNRADPDERRELLAGDIREYNRAVPKANDRITIDTLLKSTKAKREQSARASSMGGVMLDKADRPYMKYAEFMPR